MPFNPIKPVLQIGCEFDGSSGIAGGQRRIAEPAAYRAVDAGMSNVVTSLPEGATTLRQRQISMAVGVERPTEPVVVSIHRDNNVAGHFLTADNGMVIFQQLGECLVMLPEEDETVQFKIPGHIITCANVRGRFAVTTIFIEEVPEGCDRYPQRVNVTQGSVLAKYLMAERFVSLV